MAQGQPNQTVSILTMSMSYPLPHLFPIQDFMYFEKESGDDHKGPGARYH
jgi:hypothetical protein